MIFTVSKVPVFTTLLISTVALDAKNMKSDLVLIFNDSPEIFPIRRNVKCTWMTSLSLSSPGWQKHVDFNGLYTKNNEWKPKKKRKTNGLIVNVVKACVQCYQLWKPLQKYKISSYKQLTHKLNEIERKQRKWFKQTCRGDQDHLYGPNRTIEIRCSLKI